MAHKTLIGGTAYKITGGRDLIDGTGYAKKSGKVLIGGTTYEIGFEPSEFTMTISGGNTTGTNYHSYVSYDGTKYTSGTLTIPAGAVITIVVSQLRSFDNANVELNGKGNLTYIGTGGTNGSEKRYEYAPAANAEILFEKYGGPTKLYWVCTITEE